MRLTWCSCFLLALLLSWTTVQAASPLRIATEGAYPPFNYVDENGNLAGFDVDIAMALCKAMDQECTIEAIPWDNLLPELSKGNIDAVVASMARTEEREATALFTHFYYRSRISFVGHTNMRFTQTPEGVAGLSIAVQEMTTHEKQLRSNFSTANIVPTKTAAEAFAMLVKGEVDLVLCDSLPIYAFLQTEEGKRFDFVGIPLPADDKSSEACIAVNKKKPELVSALEKALKAIRLNGVYNKINRKYFPFTIY